MKYIIITFSILICISCENSINRIPKSKEKEEREYGGKVKKIVTYYCEKCWTDEHPLTIDKNSCNVFNVQSFNAHETMLEEMTWGKSNYPNKPDMKTINKINKSGLIIETTRNSVYSGDTRIIYSYNQDGFRTEKVVYYDGELSLRTETIYDEFNCPIKEIVFTENNKLSYYRVMEHDNRNREISYERYNNEDELETKRVMKYDDDSDKWTIRYSYNVKGELESKDDRKESFKTNKVSFLYSPNLPDVRYTGIEYYSTGEVKSWHFKNQHDDDVFQTYNKNGKVVERKIFNDEEWKNTFTFKYREDGSVIEESESTSRIIGKSYYKKTTYYNVDFNGNWIEKHITDSEGNVLELAMRDIEYYN